MRKTKKLAGQALDNLLDALIWMRRKAEKRQPVDELIDELVRMRRKAKKKTTKRAAPSVRRKNKQSKKKKRAKTRGRKR